MRNNEFVILTKASRRTIMKKLSVLSSALLFLSMAAFGQTLTQADREKGAQYLEQTRDGVVAATRGLSDAQMKFKSAPERWSVAETLEHSSGRRSHVSECHRQNNEGARRTSRSG